MLHAWALSLRALTICALMHAHARSFAARLTCRATPARTSVPGTLHTATAHASIDACCMALDVESSRSVAGLERARQSWRRRATILRTMLRRSLGDVDCESTSARAVSTEQARAAPTRRHSSTGRLHAAIGSAKRRRATQCVRGQATGAHTLIPVVVRLSICGEFPCR